MNTEDAVPVDLYRDPETGRLISTHSMIKTMRHCPRQAYYKYILRLKPHKLGRPLRFGTWMHSLYEAYYKGEDWRAKHEELTQKFAKLFDEEKEQVGDLPRECYRTMLSYLWHYKHEVWKVLEVEVMLEADLPDGSVYRGKIDMLIENQYGLWIVDHKNMRTLPDLDFRILDAQSALYIWAALRNKIPVQGHIWNYVRSKPPTIPKLVDGGKRLSKSAIDTDYPTLAKAIKEYELDPTDYAHMLKHLKSLQFQPGFAQNSPFFRRDVLEKSNRMLKQVASEAFATHLRMHNYGWGKLSTIERNPGNHCKWLCSYTDLCTAELFGGNGDLIKAKNYVVGDPLDYYRDERPDEGKGE